MASQLKLKPGVVHLLAAFPWQAFVSLTWKNRRGVPPGRFIQERIWFAWVREIGRVSGVSPRGTRYLWARRNEWGEATGREHLHGLIGGLPDYFIRDFVLRPRSAVGQWWERFGGGNARTSPAWSTTELVDYFTKEGNGGYEYELGKFGSCPVMVSDHAVALLEAIARTQSASSGREISAGETGLIGACAKTNCGVLQKPTHRDLAVRASGW
jgi:hypothetical protein